MTHAVAGNAAISPRSGPMRARAAYRGSRDEQLHRAQQERVAQGQPGVHIAALHRKGEKGAFPEPALTLEAVPGYGLPGDGGAERLERRARQKEQGAHPSNPTVSDKALEDAARIRRQHVSVVPESLYERIRERFPALEAIGPGDLGEQITAGGISVEEFHRLLQPGTALIVGDPSISLLPSHLTLPCAVIGPYLGLNREQSAAFASWLVGQRGFYAQVASSIPFAPPLSGALHVGDRFEILEPQLFGE